MRAKSASINKGSTAPQCDNNRRFMTSSFHTLWSLSSAQHQVGAVGLPSVSLTERTSLMTSQRDGS